MRVTVRSPIANVPPGSALISSAFREKPYPLDHRRRSVHGKGAEQVRTYSRRVVVRVLIVVLALLWIGDTAVRAAEIPENVRRAYLMGASSVALPADPVTIPLQGTDWGGHYRSPYLRVFVNGRGPYTF